MIAEAIGAPKATRAVASSCTHCRFAFAVPCHRIVSKGDAKPSDPGARRRAEWRAYEARRITP
jgi:AraC family transcriptional regulator of adaptative response/methylated-DNA-[protein]-cysteine methyltransferase